MNFHNLSSPEIRQRLAELTASEEQDIRDICTGLAELHRRREKHDLMYMYPFFREVASGKLHPLIACSTVITTQTKKTVMALKMPLQARLAEGKQMDVPVYGEDNKIVMAKKRLAQMRDEEIARAIKGDELRPYAEQAKLLESKPPRRHKSVGSSVRVIADVKNKALVIGDVRIKTNDKELIAALRVLGFQLTRIQN
jgi:hypothetical protein